MYTEKTITHDGTEFVIVGRKLTMTFECDGCGATPCADEKLTHVNVLRERAQESVTFWCDDCMEEVKAHN